MTITIDYEIEFDKKVQWNEIINDAIMAAMDSEECPYEAEISVLITDNNGIREINNEFREKDTPTDVLSFPMVDYQTPGDFDPLEEDGGSYFHPESGELLLGDIVISVDKVKEQALEYGHEERRELAFLVVHSMLHLFGYDHMEEVERKEMEHRQENILKERGYVR